MTGLEPDVEAYGPDVRVSALVDFLELWCLHDVHPSLAEVIDYAADNGWLKRLQDRYTTPDEIDSETHAGEEEEAYESRDQVDDKQELVEKLDSTVLEREAALGELYPFELISSRLNLRADLAAGPYVAILCITIAHAYSIALEIEEKPTRVFEKTVCRALRALNLRTTDFSGVRAGSANFEEAVMTAGDQIGLMATPSAVTHSVSAQDEGVDTISHLDWGDGRETKWVFIGQVTCAKSSDWRKKLGEPSPGEWQGRLGLWIAPQAFLAVPHHPEPTHRKKLIKHSQNSLIDRLRLVRWLEELTEEENAVIDAVLACDVVGI